MKARKNNRILAALLSFTCFSLLSPNANALTYFWDSNGITAGFGTAGGTWADPTTGSAIQGWSESTTGVVEPVDVSTLSTDAATDALNFGNGATGLAAGTIAVSDTVQAGAITFASGSGAIVLSGGTINMAAASTITVNNASDTISSALSGAATGLTKAGNGILTLNGANTYTGRTNLNAGTLSINSIANVNEGASSVGAPTTVSDGTISLGNAATAASLTYTGSGHTTDRVLNLAGTTGGATITHSGSGLLKFSSSFTATGNGGKALTLQGNSTGVGEIGGSIVNNGTVTATTTTAAFASNVGTITVASTSGYTVGSRISGTGISPVATITAINTGTGVLSISPNTTAAGTLGQAITITASTGVNKVGTGTWILSGNNTYTGTTSLNGGGLLRIDSANAIPGGIGSTGGSSYVLFNNNTVLGLGGTGTQPVFARPHGLNLVNGFYFQSNGGFAAFDQDRVVNIGGAGGNPGWLNGKTIILGHSTSTHKVTITNAFNITTVTRPLQVDDGSAPIDGEMSGVISHNGGAVAGVDKTGNGTVAFTGNSTFFGSLVVRSGAVVVNRVTNSGTPSPIGQGNSGFTLAGGTFRYAPVNGLGGEAATVNRAFGIVASSSLDASGTGPLILNNTGVISPDVTGQTGSWAASGSANITGLASTANLAIGMRVISSSPGIPANAVITQILSSTSVSLNANTTAAATGAPVTFGYPSFRTLTLTGTNTDSNTIAGILQDSESISLGQLSLAKTGVGRWVLTGENTFTGSVSVTGGTLALAGSGSLNDAFGITINGSGGKFVQNSTSAVTPFVTLNQGTVTGSGTIDSLSVADLASNVVSNNDGAPGAPLTIGTLDFFGEGTVNTFHTDGDFSPAVVTTNLFTSSPGVVTINPTAASWTAGTYQLIGFTGAVGGSGAGQFALGTVSGISVRQSATLGVSASAITMSVVGENPYWTGDGDGKWNTASSNNWKFITAGTPTDFVIGDVSLFNDNATGTTVVDIDAANVAPNSTIFQNNTLNYTLGSGSGFGISSGSLSKSGTGSLTIGTTNTYTGATIIEGGTVAITGAGTLGSGSALTMSGGQLNLGGTTQTVGALSVTEAALSGDTIFNGSLSATSYTVNHGVGSAVISASLLENGAAGLSKSGTGDLVLSGTNTYTGGTILSGGTLTLANASALSTGVLTIQGGSLDSGLTNLVNPNNNAQQWNGNFTFVGTNSLDLGTGAVTTNGARSINVAANTLTVGGSITPSGTAGSHLTKLGAGTLVLSGVTALGNNGIIVNGGIVRFGGSLTTNTGAGAAGNTFRIGNLANASAAWVQTGGSVTLSVNDVDGMNLGNADSSANAFGSMTIDDGTFSAPRINVGGSGTTPGTNGVGILNILNGGSAAFSAYFIGGRSAGSTGSFTLAGGALDLTNAAFSSGRTGAWGGGRVEANIGADLGGLNVGGSVNTGTNPYCAVANTASSQGIVNLLGGTLTTNAITSPAGTSTGTGINQINFNGGTLKYGGAAANGAFMNAIPAGAAGASGVFVRSGGLILDNSGLSLTLSAALLAPTGGEITSISVTGADVPGTFFTAPYVRITGGNNDATAIATINEDGSLDAIIVTNPGSGYTANPPTVTLVGGTSTGGSATTTGTAIAAVGISTSGGFTKKSTGYITISGNNTYSGVTTIEAGSITLNSAIPNPNTSFDVKSGAQAYGGWAVPGATFPNAFTIAGFGFAEGGINVSAIRSSNNQIFSGPITLAANSRIGMIETTAACTFSGRITGDFGLDIQGAHNGNSGTQTITFANIGTASDYAGNTSLSTVGYGGARTGTSTILRLGADEQIPHGEDKGNLVLNGPNANSLAILEMNGRSETINGLSNTNAAGAIIRNTSTGTSTLTIGDWDTSSSFSGVITDAGVDKILAITKIGEGTLSLTGANTYTGNTTVDAGTLELVDNAQLKFVLGATSGVNNSISGAGTAVLDGDFVIDTTAADALASGTWTLENVTSLTGAYGATFSVVGWTDAGDNKWTKANGPTKKYTFDETTGVLTLETLGYASWAAANGAGVNLNDDHDNDGVPNGVEYFLGGPSGNTTGFTALPGVTNIAGTLSVTWVMGAGYAGVYNTDFLVETSETLTGTWTTESSPGTVTISGSNVTYTFPTPLGTKKFARLKVTGP